MQGSIEIAIEYHRMDVTAAANRGRIAQLPRDSSYYFDLGFLSAALFGNSSRVLDREAKVAPSYAIESNLARPDFHTLPKEPEAFSYRGVKWLLR